MLDEGKSTPECAVVDEENNILNIVISILNNLVKTAFEEGKYWTFKNLGLVAAQCKGIAACAYS